MQDDAAHQLHVEEADAHRALERLADRGERLEEDLVERLAVLEPLPELGRLAAELVVGELLELGLERADVLRLLGEALAAPSLAEAQDLLETAVLPGTSLGYDWPGASGAQRAFARTSQRSPSSRSAWTA